MQYVIDFYKLNKIKMKSCLSTLLVILLVPVLIIASLATLLVGMLFDESSYNKVLNDNNTKDTLNSFLIMSAKENLGEKFPNFRGVFNSTKSDQSIKNIVIKLKLSDIATQGVENVIKYVNGKNSDINLYLAPTFTEVDIEAIKQDVVVIVTDSITGQKRCLTDAEYQKSIDNGETPNCRPSLTAQEILTQIRAQVDKNITFQKAKEAFNIKLPISDSNRDALDQAKQAYSNYKNYILLVWALVGILMILIILLNVFKGLSFAGYFVTVAIITGLFLSGLGVLIQFLVIPSINFTGNALGMSAEYGIDVSNTAADLVNSILKVSSNMLYVQFYIWAGAIVIISLIIALFQLIANLLLKAYAKDKKKSEKGYYIPAYSPSQPPVQAVVSTPVQNQIPNQINSQPRQFDQVIETKPINHGTLHSDSEIEKDIANLKNRQDRIV